MATNSAEVQRRSRLKTQYNITPEEYDAILDAQGGTCAICGEPPKKLRLGVDHDHKTGIVRGLLCYWCNHKVLPAARERQYILERAAWYLDEPPAVRVLGARVAPVKKRKRRKKK